MNQRFFEVPKVSTIRPTCLNCNERIPNGRSDKKFCDLDCKDQFHNRLRTEEQQDIKRVLKILRSNRRILKSIHDRVRDKPVNLQTLKKAGFDFNYKTHTVTTKGKGNQYTFVLNYGYREFEKDRYYIIRGFVESSHV